MSNLQPFHRARHTLPEGNLIVGYANWNQCDDKIVEAVIDGVNVVIWFSINLSITDTGEPVITNGPDMDCVAKMMRKIRDLGLETTHLISIGGWNSPHPETKHSAETWFKHWNDWNRNIAARPDEGFYGFDGFDWDIEGNDDIDSSYNHFSVACLDLMGRMSQIAKETGEYIVAMAPMESYLDPNQPGFHRSVAHEYPEWVDIQPGFKYHGCNTYAYLISKYGTYTRRSPSVCNIDNNDDDSCMSQLLPTFDFITIQLYEGYSHIEYNTSKLGQSRVDYVVDLVKRFNTGWEIDFSADKELKYPYKKKMIVDSTRLVIGLANGWAGDGKFLLMYPEEVAESFYRLNELGLQPKGAAFWNILDEGAVSPRDRKGNDHDLDDDLPKKEIWMARGLNTFLKVRKK